MEDDLKRLTFVLEAERELYVDYLERLNDQQKSLIENDLQGIRSSVRKISALARRGMTLEKRRREMIDGISRKLGVDSPDPSLSGLLEKCRGPGLRELERLRDTIIYIHGKIEARKARNRRLIDRSMHVIKGTTNCDGLSDDEMILLSGLTATATRGG